MKLLYNKLKKKENICQLIRYFLAGALNVFVGYTVYFILLFFRVNVQIAMGANWIAGSVNSYFWSKYWVFQKNDKNARRFLNFIILAIIFMFVSMFLVTVFVTFMGLSEIVGGILAGSATALLNFIAQKTVVFKEDI